MTELNGPMLDHPDVTKIHIINRYIDGSQRCIAQVFTTLEVLYGRPGFDPEGIERLRRACHVDYKVHEVEIVQVLE